MNIAFVGKGGSGKTTISSLYIAYLASQQQRVLAIDGDINQHLQTALGITVTPPALIECERDILSFVKGDNKLIRDAAHITRSTPPGVGSNYVTFDSELMQSISVVEQGMRFIRTGEFHEEEVGMGCYHGKIIPLEILLNHLRFEHNEWAVVDMTAGADMFSSGMFLKFDVVVIVVEPTIKSISVYQQFREYLKPYGIPLCVIANKVQDTRDKEFLLQKLGTTPLIVPPLASMRARERGEDISLTTILQECGGVFQDIFETISAYPDISSHRLSLLKDFHRTLSKGWYQTRFGYDLSSQIS